MTSDGCTRKSHQQKNPLLVQLVADFFRILAGKKEDNYLDWLHRELNKSFRDQA